MKNLSMLSIVLLLLIPSSQLAMDRSSTANGSEDNKARENRILDEAVAKSQDEHTQFQERTATPPSERAAVPSTDSTEANSQRLMGMRSAMPSNFTELRNILEHITGENPFNDLTTKIKKTDTSLNTVLAHYRALEKDNALQTLEALDAFKKEKEEFNIAGDAVYEFLARRSKSKSVIKLLMQHPAITRLSIKVTKEIDALDGQHNSKLELISNIAALKKGLEFLKERTKNLSDSSSSGSESE